MDEPRFAKIGIFKKFTRFWSSIFTLVSAAFISAAIFLDIFPVKILVAIFAAVAFVWLLFFPALYSYRIKKSRRIIAFFCSVILIGGYGLGAVYMAKTMGFIGEITSAGYKTFKFGVYARKNDLRYNSLKDLSNSEVYSVNDRTEQSKKAREEIKSNYGGINKFENNIADLGTNLLNESYNLIMMSGEDESLMEGIAPDFDTKTKKLGSITVKVKIKDISKKASVSDEPYNIFISGMDNDNNIDGDSRSDVNMLVTVNPKNKKILLTSIPRDYRIKIKKLGNVNDKMTHTGLYGIDATVAAAEDLLGLDINYYVKVNYGTVKSLVDGVGGIDIYSDKALSLPDESGETFEYVEGINHMDGRKALRFARERNSYESGDIHRNQNQQAVMAGVIEKATSSTTILTRYGDILHQLEGYISTNLTEREIRSIVRNELNDMGGWDIQKQNLVGEGNTGMVYSMGSDYVYIMEQDEKSINSVKRKILEVMGIKKTTESSKIQQ
ncbi:LCP family protein [Eubacteriales bacterium KG127]